MGKFFRKFFLLKTFKINESKFSEKRFFSGKIFQEMDEEPCPTFNPF